jgi:Minichromosome loss protein, Mcl1, middle region
MTDYFGFTMAALNEGGCVLANPCKGEKNMSTLMYRPFDSWANNSEVCLPPPLSFSLLQETNPFTFSNSILYMTK